MAAMATCLVDNTTHESLEALHKHLQHKVKMKQEVYYRDYAPVRDRHTNEVIPFKAPAADYLKREFISKTTLKAWFKANPEAARGWAMDWLKARKEEKGLEYAPTQAELRSLFSPTRLFYETLPGGYSAVAGSLGLKVALGAELPRESTKISSVIWDNREQKPLTLSVPTTADTLVCGDYSLAGRDNRGVYIERKSLTDFVGTLSDRETRAGDSNYARFIRELERAQETGSYIVMLVEASLNDAQSFPHLPWFRAQTRPAFNRETKKMDRTYKGVSPEHIFHNLRDTLTRFPTGFQALFVDGRIEAAAAVVRILSMGEAAKTADLQYLYDAKKLVLT